MDPKHRKLLSEKSQQLANCINYEILFPFIIQENIFTAAMLDDLYGKQGNEDVSVKFFLEELQTRGPDAFRKFISALNNAGQSDALECLGQDTSIICDNRPAQSHLNYVKNKHQQDNINKENYSNKFKVYKMDSIPRGYCLIINNVDFNGFQDYRYGSDLDAKRLDIVFKNLGYVVYIRRNLSDIEMEDALYRFSEKPEFKDVDSSIVIILSHGSNGCIDAVNGKKLKISVILDMFDNENCANLVGKPKLFFIQACCKGDEYSGISLSVSSDSNKTVVKNKLLTSNGAAEQERIATKADMFISFSTIENYISVGDHHFGSWYCQALIKVLKEYSDTERLYDMHLMVDAEVQRFIGHSGDKQSTELKVLGWNKQFYFNVPKSTSMS